MIIKLLPLNLCLVCFLASCTEDAESILRKASNICQSIQNGYYEMTLINGTDTSAHSYTCHFKKIKGDSLFSSLFHYKEYWKNQYKGDVFYTGDEIVTTQIKDSTATIMSKTKWKHDIKIYSGSYPLFLPFTNAKSTPLPIDSDFADGKHLFKFIGEENLNNVKCYHIQENEIPEQEINSPIQTIKIEYHFWISKENFIPIQFSYDITGLQNNDTIGQSNRYFLTKYELNSLKDSNIFTLQSISSEYKIKEYNPIKEDDRLPIGTVAPNWQLISLANQKVSLTDFKNKVVLIDFFFKSCYPCIQSLPALQALHEKYSPKGLKVIGIDPTNESGTELTPFIEKHGVNYTILVHGEEVANDYHVTGFPTIYLIDKNGKIIYTDLGYNKDLEKTIELLLLKNL